MCRIKNINKPSINVGVDGVSRQLLVTRLLLGLDANPAWLQRNNASRQEFQLARSSSSSVDVLNAKRPDGSKHLFFDLV
jgi:hypothetical protein